MANTCDCPFCFLVKDNLQICNLLVEFRGKDGWRIHTTTADGAFRREHGTHIIYIVENVKTIGKTPINHTYSVDVAEYRFDVERIDTNMYKFCFHAKYHAP